MILTERSAVDLSGGCILTDGEHSLKRKMAVISSSVKVDQ